MPKTKKDKRISVRLDPEAALRLQEVQNKGYTSSQYINNLIKGTAVIDIGQYRQLIPHLCRLDDLLERSENSTATDAIKKEVRQLWRCLKSFQENI